jgi:hypothetical protein
VHVAGARTNRNRARCPHRYATVWLAIALLGLLGASLPGLVHAQSPELAMRDFSSGQIKKGVRSIGFGGDGATWGNYSLVWKDPGIALADYGDTSYTNDNDFHFVAIGATTPSLWHSLAIYVIAMREQTNNIQLNLKSPGFGDAPVPMVGHGTDDAVFSKIAMPLGHGISAGILLSHETSHFDARSIAAPSQEVVKCGAPLTMTKSFTILRTQPRSPMAALSTANNSIATWRAASLP